MLPKRRPVLRDGWMRSACGYLISGALLEGGPGVYEGTLFKGIDNDRVSPLAPSRTTMRSTLALSSRGICLSKISPPHFKNRRLFRVCLLKLNQSIGGPRYSVARILADWLGFVITSPLVFHAATRVPS